MGNIEQRMGIVNNVLKNYADEFKKLNKSSAFLKFIPLEKSYAGAPSIDLNVEPKQDLDPAAAV